MAQKPSWPAPVPRDPSGLVASGCGWPAVSKKGVLQSSPAGEERAVRGGSEWETQCQGVSTGETFRIWMPLYENKQPAQRKLPTPHQHRVLLRLFFVFFLISFFNSFTDSPAGSCSSFEINEAFAISLSPCLPLDWHSSTAQVLCL